MSKLHVVKKARKDYPEQGIKKGDTYYWWYPPKKPRAGRGVPIKSLNKPPRSRLIASEFLGSLADLEDDAKAIGNSIEQVQDFVEAAIQLEDVANSLQDLANDQGEKLENMPESLRESPSGTLLQERQAACERIATEIDQVASDWRSVDCDNPEEEADVVDANRSRLDEVDWSVS